MKKDEQGLHNKRHKQDYQQKDSWSAAIEDIDVFIATLDKRHKEIIAQLQQLKEVDPTEEIKARNSSSSSSLSSAPRDAPLPYEILFNQIQTLVLLIKSFLVVLIQQGLVLKEDITDEEHQTLTLEQKDAYKKDLQERLIRLLAMQVWVNEYICNIAKNASVYKEEQLKLRRLEREHELLQEELQSNENLLKKNAETARESDRLISELKERLYAAESQVQSLREHQVTHDIFFDDADELQQSKAEIARLRYMIAIIKSDHELILAQKQEEIEQHSRSLVDFGRQGKQRFEQAKLAYEKLQEQNLQQESNIVGLVRQNEELSRQLAVANNYNQQLTNIIQSGYNPLGFTPIFYSQSHQQGSSSLSHYHATTEEQNSQQDSTHVHEKFTPKRS